MTLKRVELVATAKERVGKQAFALNLNRVYDDVLLWIKDEGRSTGG